MKRFWVFTGYNYYPEGGAFDRVKGFDEFIHAQIHADALDEDWVHIWDVEDDVIWTNKYVDAGMWEKFT